MRWLNQLHYTDTERVEPLEWLISTWHHFYTTTALKCSCHSCELFSFFSLIKSINANKQTNIIIISYQKCINKTPRSCVADYVSICLIYINWILLGPCPTYHITTRHPFYRGRFYAQAQSFMTFVTPRVTLATRHFCTSA